MNTMLAEQLAKDFCCTVEDVLDNGHHFNVYAPVEGRRRFEEDEPVLLGIAVVNGKLLVKGRADILAVMREKYARETSAPWFFEPENLRRIDALLMPYGCRIKTAHNYFIASEITPVDTKDFEIRWYDHDSIAQFSDQKERFCDAFAFLDVPRDEIGVAALEGGRILGMAGASSDSPACWQIGINVDKDARGRGIATMLVTLLKNEILQRGILPFYGMSNAHIESQLVALKSGFRPAWAQLMTEPFPN